MFRDFSRAILKCIFAIAVLVPSMASIAWSDGYKVLYDFTSKDRAPGSGLIVDAVGNAYGVTFGGGNGDSGSVYELLPPNQLRVIYKFGKSGAGGLAPIGNLLLDSAGNLYGATYGGGAGNPTCVTGCGTVFKLTPSSNGGLWTETVLYDFCSQANCADGATPNGGLIFDSAGNLYGTTYYGGSLNCQLYVPGCGTVFELSPAPSGWTETVLYAFTGTSIDGAYPLEGLILDPSGNLYGTAQSPGGPNNAGSVFLLSQSRTGWTFQLVYGFEMPGDGEDPKGGMIFNAQGNLYGTTSEGGAFGQGTVFELTPNSGSWTETIVHNFKGGNDDGGFPYAGLALDAAGDLYGTTVDGGWTSISCLNGAPCGTVFKLIPEPGGQWSESLFRFPASGKLGSNPETPVTLDSAGNVYGTASGGQIRGVNEDYGVLFRITQ